MVKSGQFLYIDKVRDKEEFVWYLLCEWRSQQENNQLKGRVISSLSTVWPCPCLSPPCPVHCYKSNSAKNPAHNWSLYQIRPSGMRGMQLDHEEPLTTSHTNNLAPGHQKVKIFQFLSIEHPPDTW